jgi:hypothetical protein
MKLIAKYNVQVRGHIYTKGEAMECDGPLTPRIVANFTAKDGSSLFVGQTDEPRGPKGDMGAPGDKGTPGELPLDPQPKDGDMGEDALVKRTLDALKRDGVMRQLDEMGITYPANAKGTFLARLLLMGKGEIKSGE